jgi:CBS domain containing-hemolysin-like protein
MIGGLWTALALLLLMSAVLNGAEVATFSLGGSSLRTLLDEGFSGADTLLRLRTRAGPGRAAVRLLVAIMNLLTVGLAGILGAASGGVPGAILGVVLAIPTVLLVAVVVPRSFASRSPVRLALASAPLLTAVERSVRLIVSPILRLEEVLSRQNGGEAVDPGAREAMEVSLLGQQEGRVDADERLLVERAFRLDELRAWDVMTPRVDVFAWKDDTPLRDIVADLASVPYSRVPVYGESIDDVTGILYVREAYETYISGREDTPLSSISREPFFVPGSLSLAQLLRDFQARRIHMGIVADEFGGTDGLVTLEDVLEELVGEIVDETDVEDEPLRRISRFEVVADGGVDLREINYALNVSLPQLEHRSLNGYILEELGYVPESGDVIDRAGMRIEVLEASDTQVHRMRLTRLQPGDGVADSGT